MERSWLWGARAGVTKLTLGGTPACGPGGAGESDHQDSNCLVNSSTLAAAVSNSICFRSMCFMASAGCGSEGQDHAPYTPSPCRALPIHPCPQLTLEVQIQKITRILEGFAVHGAGRSKVPARMENLLRPSRPRPSRPKPKEGAQGGDRGVLQSLRFQNANSFKNPVHVHYLPRSLKPF